MLWDQQILMKALMEHSRVLIFMKTQQEGLIIFEKDFKVFDAKHLLIKTPNGLWASDHHPVYLHCSL